MGKNLSFPKKTDGCKSLIVNKNEVLAKPLPLKNNFLQEQNTEGGVKVILIDHCAERSFELKEGAGFAITVGDDTTEIAGSILSRFGIPVLGITDGDCDELATAVNYASGSLILHLKPGRDDELGRKLQQDLFSGKYTAFFENLDSLKQKVITLAEYSLESVSKY